MDIAAVSIRFSAEGEKQVTTALNAINRHTKDTANALKRMEQVLKSIDAKGLVGAQKQMDATSSSAAKLQAQIRRSAKTIKGIHAQYILYGKTIYEAQKKSEQYAIAVRKLGRQYGITNTAMKRWLPELKRAEEYIRKKSVAMNVAGRAGDAYYQKMDRLAVMERQISGVLGTTSKSFKRQKTVVDSTSSALERNAKIAGKTRRGLKNLIPHVAAVTLSYMAMRRAVDAVTTAIEAGAEFEHQMALVGGIVRTTATDFDLLNSAAREAGETTVWTATEAAQALRYLGMAGFSASESIEALQGVLNLALIGELDLGRATDIATDTLRAFGLEAKESNRVVDVFVGTITRSNTNIESLGQAMKFVAPVASKLGYTIEEVSAMIGILSQSGIKSGIAGRALRMSFLKQSEAAEKLGIEAGNLIDVLRELKDRNLSPTELTATLKDLFGIRSTPALLTLMEGMDQLEQFTNTLNNAKGETDEFIEGLDTVTVAWEKFKSVLTDIAIEIFVSNAKDLKGAIKDVTEALRNNKDDIKTWAEAIKNVLTVGKDLIKLVFTPLALALREISELSNKTGIADLFERMTKAAAALVLPITGIYGAISQTWDSFMRFLEWESSVYTGEAKLKKAVKEANDAYAERLSLMADQGEMEDEYNSISDAVGSIAFALRQEAAAASEVKGIIQSTLKEFAWYDLLSIEEQNSSEKIKRLKAIAKYEESIIQELKEEYGTYYDEDLEQFKKYIEAKVAGFTEQYDAAHKILADSNKPNTEAFLKENKAQLDALQSRIDAIQKAALQEIKIALKKGEDISKIEKDTIDTTNKLASDQMQIINAMQNKELEAVRDKYREIKSNTALTSEEVIEISMAEVNERIEIIDKYYNVIQKLEENRTQYRNAVSKAELVQTEKDLKKAEVLYLQFNKKVAKYTKGAIQKETVEQILANLEKQIAFVEKQLGPLSEEFKNMLREAITEDFMKKFTDDKLQAMKSLYKDLEKVSGNYYVLQIQVIENEYKEYLKSLGLKKAANEKYTEEEKRLLNDLNQWKIQKYRESLQELLIAQGGFTGGILAYLIQMQTDWENVMQNIGQFGYDTMDKLGDAFEDSFVKLFTEGTESAKEVWDNFLDDLLASFLKLIAQMIKEWVLSGLLNLVIGVSGSGGSGGLSIGGRSGGGGVGIGSLLSLGSTVYKLLAGETFATTVGNALGGLMGASTTAQGFGYIGTIGTASYAAPEIGMALGGGLEASTAGSGGAMSSFISSLSAAAPALAVAAAAATAWAIAIHQARRDASISVSAVADLAEDASTLFNFAITGMGASGFSEGDARKQGSEMAEKMASFFGMYENIYQNVSDESQKALKTSLEAIDWENWVFNYSQVAQEGRRPYMSAHYYNQEYTPFRTTAFSNSTIANSIADIIGFGTAQSHMFGTGPQILNKLMGRYFKDYIDEALTNIKGKEIFSLLSAELTSSFKDLDVELFSKDPDAFFAAFSKTMDKLIKAESVWKSFNRWLGGTFEMLSASEKAANKAEVATNAYVKKMKELGVEMSKTDISNTYKTFFSKFSDSIGSMAIPLSGLDKYLIQVNAQFDAYLVQLQKYGVDISKITDLEEKRAKKLKEATEEYTKVLNEAIESAIEGIEGLAGDLESAVKNINSTFKEVLVNLATEYNLAAAGVDVHSMEDVYKYYEEGISKAKAALEALWKPIEDKIAGLNELINILNTPSADISKVKAYFEAVQNVFNGMGVDIEALLPKISSSFSAVKSELHKQITAFKESGEFYAPYAVLRAQDLLNSISDFIVSLGEATTAEDLAAGFANISDGIDAYREIVELVEKRSENYELREYAGDILSWLDGVESMIGTFKTELDSLTYASVQEIASDASDALKGTVGALNQYYTTLKYSGPVLEEISVETKAFMDKLSNWLNSFSTMSEEEILSGFSAISDDLDSLISSVENMRSNQAVVGDSAMSFLLNSYLDYLKGLQEQINYFEDELQKASDAEGARERIAQILSDLGKGDYQSAIEYLEEQIQFLKDTGASSETIREAQEQLNELNTQYERFIELEERQLDAIKRQLGLITDAEYKQKRLSDIYTRYGDYLSKFGINTIEEFVEAFKNADLETIKAAAKELGITWQELTQDVAFLIEQEQELLNVRRAQAELQGKNVNIWDISERYGLSYSKIDKSFAQKIASKFLSMSAEEVKAWAESLGVSVDDLVSDIMWLADHFGLVGDAALSASKDLAEMAQKIRDILNGVRETIAGGGGSTAAGLMSQITGMQSKITDAFASGDLSLSMENLLSMSQLLAQWYDKAVAEAQDAAREVAEAQRDELYAQREALQEQLNVAQAFGNLVDTIESTIKSIKYGVLNVSLPREKATEAQQDYQRLKKAALASGAVEDYQAFVGFAQTYLQQQQAAYKSSGAYQAIYGSVMADLEAAKSTAEAQSYDEAILSELESIDATIEAIGAEADLSGINATFESMASWIESLVDQIEHLDTILHIQWDNFDGDMATALGYLTDIVNVYGWDNEVTINWIADFARWSAQDVESAIQAMDYVASASGGWDTEATITFIANLSSELANLTDAKAVLDHLVAETGWDSIATITFMANIPMTLFSDVNDLAAAAGWIAEQSGGWNTSATISFLKNVAGNWEFEDIDQILGAIGWVKEKAGSWTAEATISFIAELMDRYNVPIEQIDYWLEQMGITDTEIQRSVKINLMYEMVSSGSLDLSEVAEWAYNQAYAAWMESPGSSAAISILKDLKGLAGMWGVPDAVQLGNYIDAYGGYNTTDQNWWDLWTKHGEDPHFYATGGIIDSPTLGWIGEAGYPEAVIPMLDGTSIPVKWTNAPTQQNDRPIDINLTLEIDGEPLDLKIKSVSAREADNIRVKAERRNLGRRRMLL